MKKTLVALAALAATGAFAQSSVTMYGIIDVSYGVKTHTAGNGVTLSKMTGIGEGLNAGNRIGFRGTEDLGGGLKANFVIENGINITNGNLFSTRAAASGQQYDGLAGGYGTNTNRQSFVALDSAKLGQVRLGFQYTNLYTLSTLSGYTNASEQPGGDTIHLLGAAVAGGTRGNAITYISPRFYGVQATFQHGAGTGRELVEFNAAATNSADRKTDAVDVRNSLLLNFNGVKNLNASYAYTANNSRSTTGAAAALATTAAPVLVSTMNNFGVSGVTLATAPIAATSSDITAKLHQLGASYTFPIVKLSGTYNMGTTDLLGGASTKLKGGQVGIEGLFMGGALRPFLQIGSATVNNTTAAGVEATANEFKTQQFGVRYDLSKRTTAYFMMGNTKDDAVAAASASVAKREVTALGIFHAF